MWGIPASLLGAEQIRTGVRGVTTHAEVTKAFKTPGGHLDPGPGFPTQWFCGRVASILEEEEG
jgi:hypothetical protein